MIAARLRQAIADGELQPGSQLGETDLSRSLGVSRGPLREGMQRLTQEGLLVSIRNRGLFVVELKADDVRDIYIARAAVERAAAAQIFAHEPALAAWDLLRIVDQMSAADRAGDTAEVGELDIAFHNRLVTLAGSPRLSRTHRTLLTETKMCVHAMQITYPLPDERVPEHREIAEAFTLDDPAVVDRLLVTHMGDAVRRLLTVVPPS